MGKRSCIEYLAQMHDMPVRFIYLNRYSLRKYLVARIHIESNSLYGNPMLCSIICLVRYMSPVGLIQLLADALDHSCTDTKGT